MNIVLTGFEPFGLESMNPSWEAVRALPDQIGPATIIRYCLPVEYRAVRPKLLEILRTHQPYAMICVGQAGGRAMITPERIAINLMDARSADESGYLAEEEPIRSGGPDAYFSGLPGQSDAGTGNPCSPFPVCRYLCMQLYNVSPNGSDRSRRNAHKRWLRASPVSAATGC